MELYSACDKTFDLYNHLKCNVKYTNSICEIHDSIFSYYCFQCKRSICEVCKETFHGDHLYCIEKNLINLDMKSFNVIFGELEHLIVTTEVFSNPDKIIRNLKDNVNYEFDEMINKINDLRVRKIREIDRSFNNNNEDAVRLLKNIKFTKEQLMSFFKSHRYFLQGNNIQDDDSFIFLQLFDIFNEGIRISKDYSELILILKDFYSEHDFHQNNKCEQILKPIEEALEEQKKTEIMQNNLFILDANDMDKDNNSDNDFDSSTSLNKLESGKPIKGVKPNTKNNNTNTNSEEFKELTQLNDQITKKIELRQKLSIGKDKLTENMFTSLTMKLDNLNDHIF